MESQEIVWPPPMKTNSPNPLKILFNTEMTLANDRNVKRNGSVVTTVHFEVWGQFAQVHGVCALNVAEVSNDQEIIKANKQQKYIEDINERC